ncbi:hypothetical protein RvY_02045 [Ramazzottius varieornatus]|uniref:Glutathione reductase n=1 Tax=Ramazzottius varieornatus TaxID=947166 RepID=A0A1D1ULS1_RAMVA|nr:hypothetical protein RvY_02045 [Ramazzottius varieornatus]
MPSLGEKVSQWASVSENRNDKNECDYDLVVLGGGSGGIATARKAATFGAKVVLVEAKHELGGTCVNVGCVPKKITWNAASLAMSLEHDMKDYGFDVEYRGFDWLKFKEKRDAYVRTLNGIYRENLKKDGIELVQGRGKFDQDGNLKVGDRTLEGRFYLIAAGGRPKWPEIPGADLGIDSDGFFQLEKQPKSVAVVGGGYIGVEICGMFRALGSKAEIFIKEERPLIHHDEMLGNAVTEQFRSIGINLHFNVKVSAVEKAEDKTLTLVTPVKKYGGFDCVLWAIGRSSNADQIEVKQLGIEVNDRGRIHVDKYQKTSRDNIFALGDITGQKELTPVAIAAGRRLATRLFGNDKAYLNYDNIASVVFGHPPMASVGLNEEEAKTKYGEDKIRIDNTSFTPMYYAMTQHKAKAAIKMISTKSDDKIVGLHMVGPGSDEAMQGFAIAIRMGATRKDFGETVSIHPTCSEEVPILAAKL